jgi:hypothetical protein
MTVMMLGEVDPGLMKMFAASAARHHGVDPNVICAMCEVESSWNPWSMQHERTYRYLWEFKPVDSGWEMNPALREVVPGACTQATEMMLQRTSLGLLQVMGATAREWGMTGWLTLMLIPEIGLEYGVRFFKHLLDKYNGVVADAVSAYNQGSPRHDENGIYFNQKHVDKVLAAAERYRREADD